MPKQGKPGLFLAIGRVSKAEPLGLRFGHAEFRDDAGNMDGAAFLRGVAEAFRCPGLEKPQTHALAFVSAHSLAKHLKALRWRTPFEAVCRA